jgi:hypothetical protein
MCANIFFAQVHVGACHVCGVWGGKLDIKLKIDFFKVILVGI